MGRLLVKTGVDFGTALAPAGARILDVVKRLAPTYDFDIVITSARDGVHSGPTDPHGAGEAFDFRSRTLNSHQKQRFLADLRTHLYRDPRRFFAFLEKPGTPNEHIHCQRRLGTTYSVFDYLDDL